MVAAAGEPVDPGTISRWLGLAESATVRRLCADGTRRGTHDALAPDGHGRLLHALQSLLEGRLFAAAVTAHGRIADHYLALWGGLAGGLPLLAAHLRLGDVDGGYGLRHLVRHLLGAGRSEEAHRLLACERPAGQGRPGMVNLWFDARHRAGEIDGYLQDLEAAQRTARATTDTAAGGSAPSLGLEMRYTLMRVCAQQADRPRGSVAMMLLKAGIWDHSAPSPLERRGGRVRRSIAVPAT